MIDKNVFFCYKFYRLKCQCTAAPVLNIINVYIYTSLEKLNNFIFIWWWLFPISYILD